MASSKKICPLFHSWSFWQPDFADLFTFGKLVWNYCGIVLKPFMFPSTYFLLWYPLSPAFGQEIGQNERGQNQFGRG